MSSNNATRVSGNLTPAAALERARLATIINSSEGKARPEAALRLALNSELAADSAVELLRTLPAENPYLQAMEKFGPSGLAASHGAVPQAGSREARMAEITSSMKVFNASMGYGSHRRNS